MPPLPHLRCCCFRYCRGFEPTPPLPPHPPPLPPPTRHVHVFFVSLKRETGVRTAQHAWEKSCYFNIDYKIDEGSTVYDAISRMSAYNVGCLIVTKDGVVS